MNTVKKVITKTNKYKAIQELSKKTNESMSKKYLEVVEKKLGMPIVKPTKISKQKAIIELSKAVNKTMHEKYIKPILNDCYNR